MNDECTWVKINVGGRRSGTNHRRCYASCHRRCYASCRRHCRVNRHQNCRENCHRNYRLNSHAVRCCSEKARWECSACEAQGRPIHRDRPRPGRWDTVHALRLDNFRETCWDIHRAKHSDNRREAARSACSC